MDYPRGLGPEEGCALISVYPQHLQLPHAVFRLRTEAEAFLGVFRCFRHFDDLGNQRHCLGVEPTGPPGCKGCTCICGLQKFGQLCGMTFYSLSILHNIVLYISNP